MLPSPKLRDVLMEFLNMQIKFRIISILMWLLGRVCVSMLLEDMDGSS